MNPFIQGEMQSTREKLRAYLRNRLVLQSGQSQRIVARPGGIIAPLALAQEPIFRRTQQLHLPPLYNESVTIQRSGPLDVPVLERVITEIVRRHEIWRTTFMIANDSDAVQVVHERRRVFLPLADIRHIAPSRRDAEAIRLGEQDALQRFDLCHGPLVRFRLVRLDDQNFRLFVMMHQIVCDGISVFRIFLSELAILYEEFSQNKPSSLPELPLQYGDFAYWQRQALEPELYRQSRFWHTQLGGELPVLRWPMRRPANQTFKGHIKPFTLPRELTERIRMLAASERVTLFTVLIAAVAAVLHFYTSQHDVILGTVSPSGRKHSEVQDLMGYFLNPVCLRMELSGDPEISELLRRAREVLSVAMSNDDIPIETLAEQMGANSDPSRHAFFTVATSLEPPLATVDGWTLTPMDLQTGGARWDVYVVFDDRQPGMLGRVQYNPDLLDPSQVSRLIDDVTATLMMITAGVKLRLSHLARHLQVIRR